jgi:gliding motility-associated-like protein
MPADTGWIDACPNTTRVSFKGKGIYELNDISYHQSDTLSKFEWNFGDGSPIAYGPDVSHIFDRSGGFVVKLTIIDTVGCRNVNYIKQRVRISPRPTFNIGALVSQVCAGTEVKLRGRSNRIDPNYNISTITNTDSFQIGQVRSETLFIPDDGTKEYTTNIFFSDFSPGQILTSINDLTRIFVNMEHSYARDLEIRLICPNRQSVILHKYDVPTRNTNRILIGVPRYGAGSDGNGANTNNPLANPAGTGFLYAWTPTATRTWRSYTTPSTYTMPAGNYRSEDPLTNLIGCPLNGEWTINVKDQFPQDNGWIFKWGIDFAARLYPTIERFTPMIVDAKWVTKANVVNNMGDSLVARPRNAGVANFMYQVRDNFNCVFDTSINVSILPFTNPACVACDNNFNSLTDTNICSTGTGVSLTKAYLGRVNPSVVFEAFPNSAFDALSATLLNPLNSMIRVQNVFIPTLTNPVSEIDSVCFSVNTNVADDVVIQLKAPNNATVLLKPNRVGGVQQPLQNVCFSPSATRPIATATAPLTGIYQANDGAAAWNVLNGSAVNGNWQLLYASARGGHTDTLTQWSITFKSGNAQRFSWTPSTGLSCTNCASPTARPTQTTDYIVTVVDSMNCTHRDTVRVRVLDSLAAPSVSVGNLNFTFIQFAWTPVAGATAYQVSIDSGRTWIPPNGTLAHTINGLRTGQSATIWVRALGGTCGARIAQLTETTRDCIATIGRGVNRRLEIDSILCFGGTSPFVNFAFANGVQPLTYKIDTFTQLLDPVYRNKIKAGWHKAVVIDGEGCTDTLIFYLGQPEPITLPLRADSVKCSGDATGKVIALATGGAGNYRYSLNLSPFQRNIGTFDSLRAGRYIVEVEDSNRCRKRDSITVFQPNPLSMNLLKSDVRCFGRTDGSIRALLSGGVSPYTFTWNSGDTNPNVSSLPVGTYTVTATDRNGCQRIDSARISSNPRILITTLQDSVLCFGSATGRARARVTGGVAPYTFNWNNSQFDSVATNLKAGLQRLTLIDAAGCTDTASIEVLEPAKMVFDSIIGIPASCASVPTGIARVVMSGGVQPYTYSWSPTARQTQTITNLSAGLYLVNVTDAKGCIARDSVRITAAPPLVVEKFEMINNRCFGDSTGSLTARVSGGSGSYTYRWSTTPAQTTEMASNIPAGRYTITITDDKNCQLIKDTTLTQPPRLVATISQFKNVSCKGLNDGTATPSVLGGSPFQGSFRYQFLWNDARRTDKITADSLAAGRYIVTVTDANGCIDTANITITEPATALEALATQTKLSCYDGINGEARVTASGGASGYRYLWSNLQNTQTATTLSQRMYYVTVTDLNGCRDIDSVFIQTYDSIRANLTIVQPRCFNTATGNISLTAVNGGAGNNNLGNYFYRWNTNPAQTAPQANGLVGGRTYSVTVTDAEGCSNVFYQFLTQPGPILIAGFSSPVRCFGENSGSATVNPIGSSNVFTYRWNDPLSQTTQTSVNLRTGRYSVTVTDSSGCQRDTAIDVSQPSRLRVESKTITDSKCVGDTTGSIQISITGGIPTYRIAWSSGDSGFVLPKLRAGTYIASVNDANGCRLFDTLIIKSPPALDADIAVVPVKCFGDRNGSIIVDAFGGTKPYQFSLNGKDFNGNSQIVGVRAGSYDVYLKDANGCIWFDNTTVSTPPKFLVEASPDITINLGDKVQLFANPVNNQGRVTLNWKPPYDSSLTCVRCNNPTASPMYTITYVVNGTDTVGCRAADSVKVTVVKQPIVLVPTGFSPNDDKVNDKLIVHGKSGTTIRFFRIYDRWGELLFEARDFKINDETAGWDGSFRGQSMGSGVYVWYVEAEFMDKSREIFKGHTTLIR